MIAHRVLVGGLFLAALAAALRALVTGIRDAWAADAHDVDDDQAAAVTWLPPSSAQLQVLRQLADDGASCAQLERSAAAAGWRVDVELTPGLLTQLRDDSDLVCEFLQDDADRKRRQVLQAQRLRELHDTARDAGWHVQDDQP